MKSPIGKWDRGEETSDICYADETTYRKAAEFLGDSQE